MQNFIQAGDTVEFTAAADVASGDFVLAGALGGVATGDVATGAVGTMLTTGVFALPKAPSQAWTVGARVYWDAANSRFTTVASGNTLMGCAVEAVGAGAGETIGKVRLNGVA